MKRVLQAGGCLLAGMLLLIGCICSLVGGVAGFTTIQANSAASSSGQGGQGAAMPDAAASVIVQHALQMAAHLHPGPPDQFDVSFDSGFPAQALAYWDTVCGKGCGQSLNGHLQCGQFVGMAYGWAGLPLINVAASIDWWQTYNGYQQPGWVELADGTDIPLPGDVLIMSSPLHGGVGHSGIVVAVTLPHNGVNGSLTFAEANGPTPLVTQPLATGYRLQTWSNYTVMGYIRHTSALPADLPTGLPVSPYVSVAVADATQAGIPVRHFVAQIEQESGFNPLAISGAGAQGIAQIMPATAQAWNVDSWDPTASLWAAAQHMATYQTQYGGDFAKALAAYNAGPGALDQALSMAYQTHTSDWLGFLPAETQHYVTAIMAA